MADPGGGYAHVWEFIVQAAQQPDFERHYGPDGSWVRLFRQADGYIGTQLWQDRSNPLRYLTVDRWAGIEAYRAFKARFADQYAALDRECEGLSARETPFGEYAEVPRRRD